MLLVTLIILNMRRLIDGQANMKGRLIGGVVRGGDGPPMVFDDLATEVSPKPVPSGKCTIPIAPFTAPALAELHRIIPSRR